MKPIANTQFTWPGILIVSLALTITSCFTTDDKELESEKVKRTIALDRGLEGANPQNVFRWQQHFKDSPSLEDKKKIEQSLRMRKGGQASELISQARNFSSLHELDKAEALYREALRLDSDNVDVQLELAQLLAEKDDIPTALNYVAEAKSIIERQENPTRELGFKYHFTLALIYLKNDRIEEGRRLLKELLHHQKDFAPSYFVLAASYLETNQEELAQFTAKRGLDQLGEREELQNIMGVLSKLDGKQIEARRWFDMALKKNGSYIPALINRANLSIARHEFAAAEEDLQRALTINPRTVEAHIAIGILFKKTGRFTSAQQSLERAIELDGENAMARFNLAVLLAEDLNKKNQALRLFYEVIQTAQNDSEIQQLAKAHIQGLRENQIRLNPNEL